MGYRRPRLPALDLPGTFPAGAAPVSCSPLALVSAEWLPARYLCSADPIRESTAAPVVSHGAGLVFPDYGRNSPGAGTAGGIRYFAGRDRQLSLPAWAPSPSGHPPVYAQPCPQAANR